MAILQSIYGSRFTLSIPDKKSGQAMKKVVARAILEY